MLVEAIGSSPKLQIFGIWDVCCTTRCHGLHLFFSLPLLLSHSTLWIVCLTHPSGNCTVKEGGGGLVLAIANLTPWEGGGGVLFWIPIIKKFNPHKVCSGLRQFLRSYVTKSGFLPQRKKERPKLFLLPRWGLWPEVGTTLTNRHLGIHLENARKHKLQTVWKKRFYWHDLRLGVTVTVESKTTVRVPCTNTIYRLPFSL